jgi:hypothetical protein
MPQILTETSSKWGNTYRHKYYLDGQRISDEEADRIFNNASPKQISSEKLVTVWRSKWEIET